MDYPANAQPPGGNYSVPPPNPYAQPPEKPSLKLPLIIGAVIVVLAIIGFSFLLIGAHASGDSSFMKTAGKSPDAAAKECGMTFDEEKTDSGTAYKELRYATDDDKYGLSPYSSRDIECFLDSMGVSDKDASALIGHHEVKRESGKNYLFNIKTDGSGWNGYTLLISETELKYED